VLCITKLFAVPLDIEFCALVSVVDAAQVMFEECTAIYHYITIAIAQALLPVRTLSRAADPLLVLCCSFISFSNIQL
jgi:hypothetical protein